MPPDCPGGIFFSILETLEKPSDHYYEETQN